MFEMTEEEILSGNNSICQMIGFKKMKPYHYKVPNMFPCEEAPNTGWTETRADYLLFHKDWNYLIYAYNIGLRKLQDNVLVQKVIQMDENFVVNFGTKNFFGLFENQLHISSSWIKLVDFAKLYNAIVL